MQIRPFLAVTPLPNMAARVSSPPYDVMDGAEARAMVAGKPESFLRVTRSEVDLPEEADPYSDAVYARARANYERLQDEGTLVRSDEPELFIYRQARNGKRQTCVMTVASVAEYEAGVIRKHELTRAEKEADRTRHIAEVGAQTGPVFLAYRDVEAISDAVHWEMNDRPRFHFVAEDGVTHTLWRARKAAELVEMFGSVGRAYIADGHHRAASAANVARERMGEEAKWFLAGLFAASELTILPYHRLVKDLNGLSPEAIVRRLREIGSVTETHSGEADEPGVFCVYLDGVWRRVEVDRALIAAADPIESLDVSVVQRLVLEPMFGIKDVRRDKRIEFLGGVHGPEGIAARVDGGAAAVGISMHATTMEQLLAVADAELIMPPKSTWFEPKLRDGLVVHEV